MSESSVAVSLAAGGSGDGRVGGECILMRPDLDLYAVAAPLGSRPVAASFVFEALTAARHRGGDATVEELRATILDAEERWRSQVSREPSLRGLGCCLAAVILRCDHLVVAHLGDCGVLLVRGADIVECTRDHTMRTEPDRRHPGGQTAIVRAFGMPSDPEVRRWSLEPHDRLVLTAEVRLRVPDEEIAEVTAKATRASEVVPALLARALERGATGDVSAIVVFHSGRTG